MITKERRDKMRADLASDRRSLSEIPWFGDADMCEVLDAIDAVEAERDAIARARNCGAGEDSPTCLLPPGNLCDACHIRGLAVGQLTEIARRYRDILDGWIRERMATLSASRKRMHLIAEWSEAEAEDARRETARQIRKAVSVTNALCQQGECPLTSGEVESVTRALIERIR